MVIESDVIVLMREMLRSVCSFQWAMGDRNLLVRS